MPKGSGLSATGEARPSRGSSRRWQIKRERESNFFSLIIIIMSLTINHMTPRTSDPGTGVRGRMQLPSHLRPRLSLSSYTAAVNERELVGHLRTAVQPKRKFSHFLGVGLISGGARHHQEIVDQAKCLCGQYLRSKLKSCKIANKKLGLQRLKSVTRFAIQASNDHSLKMAAIHLGLLCQELERSHPNLFFSVLSNVGWRSLSTTTAVQNLLQSVAREIFRNDITWGRVVAFFAVVGALAADCVKLGRPEYVLTLVEVVGTFVDRDLAIWIAQQGGWVQLQKQCKKTKRTCPTGTQVGCIGIASVLLIIVTFWFWVLVLRR